MGQFSVTSDAIDDTSKTVEIEELIKIHWKKVFNVCLRMCRSPHWAEDLTQDVFIKISAGYKELKDKSSAGSWIYKIAVHTCLDHLRREKSWSEKIKKLFLGQEKKDSFEDKVINKDLGMRILSQLSPVNRSVLILKSYLDLSYKEIAEIMDMTPSSAGAQISRARKEAVKIAKKEGLINELPAISK